MKYKKTLGQHFLNNENVCKKISEAISHKEHIVEIGPGSGNLTKHIVDIKPKTLTLVEYDNTLIEILNNKFNNKKTTIINADALNICPTFLNTTICSNLPYNISTALLCNWLEYGSRIKEMILMFQLEVGNRIIAQPNNSNYGKLSVLVQSCCKIEKVCKVSPGSFFPPPKVDSIVLKITPFADLDLRLYKILNHAFSQRRKMIKHTLVSQYNPDILDRLGIKSTYRAENLSVQQYTSLALSLKTQ